MNILVTNFDNSYEDVMIFTEKEHITPEWVKEELERKGLEFTDICEVKDHELENYIYEPCHL